MYCILDFETRSPCDIQKHGAWNYSKHPQTEILCASVWDSVSKSVRTWEIDYFAPVPVWFSELVRDCDHWIAHNAFFEIAMWKNCLTRDFPCLPCPSLDKWVDTRAIVLYWSLPQGLERASAILGHELKDKEGSRLMLKMCKPRKPSKKDSSKYHWTHEDMDRLMQYCEQDVITTKSILDDLGNLQKCERPVFELDKIINHRGFPVDLELAKAAYKMAEQMGRVAEARLSEITGGYINTPNQHARFKKFALQHGIRMKSTDKEAVTELLERPNIPKIVRQVFEIRQQLGKASVAKYAKCINIADRETGRVYDGFVYHKAGPGRWAGQGFQGQNLPRGELKLSDTQLKNAIEAVKTGGPEGLRYLEACYPDKIMQLLSDLVRSVICAPKGKKLIAADFASIEARGALWLAKEKAAVELLRNGGDLYKDMASTIFGVPVSEVTKDQRFVGKTAILGLGYGMGADKFSAQAKIDIALAAKAVEAYRRKFPGIPKLWRELENAKRRCIQYKIETAASLFKFYWKSDRVVAMVLPSGREIHYWDPIVDYHGGIKYWTTSGNTGKWIQVDTWGGKILENGDQGMCSCLLRNAMLQLDAAQWPIIMTVHDEVVCELPDDLQYNADKMIHLMIEKLPAWAKGFPLAAEGWEGERFRK